MSDKNVPRDIQVAIKEINKKHGDDTVRMASDKLNVVKFSTGSPYIDWALEGGFPIGRTIEIYGGYSAGKSLIALRTIASAQEQGLNCVYIDVEMSFDPDFARRFNVNLKTLPILQMGEGDELFDYTLKLINSGVNLIVIDSVASILPNYEKEHDMEKQTMGLHARLMSKGLRKVTSSLRSNNSTIIFLNQIREKIGAYGNPEITTGGRALGFYTSVRMEVRRGEWYTENKDKIGQEIRFCITKSKVSQPFRQGYLKYYFRDGFDYVDELTSMLIVTGAAERSGSYYTLLGEKFQGREALEERLKNDGPFRDKAEQPTLNSDKKKKCT